MERPPLFSGDPNTVQEFYQKQYGIASAGCERPVLATFSLTSCVAFGGYDANQRIGFLTHYDLKTEIESSLQALVNDLCSISKKRMHFDTRLVGGVGLFGSKRIIDVIKEYMRRPNNTKFSFDLTYEDTLGFPRMRSVAIDTSSGEWFRYTAQDAQKLMDDFWTIRKRAKSYGPAERVCMPPTLKELRKKRKRKK